MAFELGFFLDAWTNHAFASKASWPELRTSVEGAFESQKHLRRGEDLFDLLDLFVFGSLGMQVQRSISLILFLCSTCFRTKDLAQALKQVMAL